MILDLIVNGIEVFLYSCSSSVDPIWTNLLLEFRQGRFGSTCNSFGSRIFLIFNILEHTVFPSINTLSHTSNPMLPWNSNMLASCLLRNVIRALEEMVIKTFMFSNIREKQRHHVWLGRKLHNFLSNSWDGNCLFCLVTHATVPFKN